MSSDLWHLATALTIAHHIPGRIRLKLAAALPGGGDLSPQAVITTLSAVDGVTSVNVNPLARSCTIAYDTTKITAQAWIDLIGQTRSDDADALLAQIAQALPRAAQ